MSPIFIIIVLFVQYEAPYEKKIFFLHYRVFFLAGANEKWWKG